MLRFVLLFVVASLSAACDTGCGCSCRVGYSGRDIVNTFDGASYTINSNNKFVWARTQFGGKDQCKFQVRFDSEVALGSQYQLGWIGVGFGVHHANSDKHDKNFRVSLTQGIVEMRGRGFPSPVQVGCTAVPTDIATKKPGEDDYHFTVTCPQDGVFIIRGWVESGRDCAFTVVYEEAGSGGNGAEWDRAMVSASGNYWGRLEGMCGNWDGTAINDDDFCPDSDPAIPVSQRCIDGEHQGN